MPEDRAPPQPGQEARVSSDEAGSRIPLKECSSSGPQRPERDRPDLLQGGGVALMFGGPVGHWPINETRPRMNPKASKLSSAIPPYIKSEVPPADPSSEVAIAAPLAVHAPMDLGY
jgi:hypothetical protein